MPTPDQHPDYLDVNRTLWNAKVAYHLRSEFYDVAGFRAGRSSLNPLELALLGEVSGQRILHLQCHFGQDSISLARLGAQVTGVDLSDEAIRAARQLAAELQAPTEFVCSDVYRLPEVLPSAPGFDVVYTSYGVLGWLPDLSQWAQVAARYLRPGGRLVLVEFHPVVWMFDDQFTRVEYSYFNREAIEETTTGTYADATAPLAHRSISWNHDLGEVLGSLLRQGLVLQDFQEYDYSPYNCLAGLQETAPGRYQLAALPGKLPLVYSVVMQRPC
ncbi:SAM-dependent methyltransferase [Hymenobacter luteus]|uniref:SAM-dependent methyltransferase n=2 Tax=Hymenobacter TaxID=89966 RepID=A0A7W9SZA5_9BACT|nr:MULTISPECIES: class I SAM-dependent methyltransferase [Hymenobacter]MBB4601178.1 SAM-dependent methyltransferase [Hymenobacter latericoloratus]MBB6058615.1 SAM-dependent methyltransferase [Hymenobacter luteus]